MIEKTLSLEWLLFICVFILIFHPFWKVYDFIVNLHVTYVLTVSWYNTEAKTKFLHITLLLL